MHSRIIWLSATVLLFPFDSVSQGDSNKFLKAYALSANEVPVLDGIPDEAWWQLADSAYQFLQQEPIEQGPASERTVVRVAFDSQNLYISAWLYDSDPSGIKGFQRKWDNSLATDDRFMFILDTYDDQRSAYMFEVNPLGLMGDGLLKVGQGSTLNKAWNGIWRAWVRKGDYGWSVEIRIPFRTLNFDPENDTWGINFQRTVRRKNEELVWSGAQRNQGLFRPQNAGKLTGLQGVSQGIGLEVIPYGIVSNATKGNGDSFENEVTANAGFDANYSLTPNLRAGITVNTDFAETEVDDRQVNLTRFPLFFPERRSFFLEGSSVFLYAPGSNAYPFFSRRIGLQDGRPVPLVAGARMIGRIRQTDVGFYQIRTRATEDQSSEDFTVTRVVQNVGKESTLGLVYTRRADTEGVVDDRHTIGADMELNSSTFLGNKNMQLQGFFIAHNDPAEQDTTDLLSRSNRGVRLNFPNQPWSGHVSYREYAPNFDPAVGFVQRTGIRRLQPTVTYSPLVEKSDLIREVTFEIDYEHLMNMEFRPATINAAITFLGVRFETGDAFTMLINRNYELLDFDFDIRRDGQFVVPIGQYYNWEYSFEAATASFRRISGSFTFTTGGFWTGTKNDYTLGLTARPAIGVNISATWLHSQVHLGENSFDTHIFRLINSVDLSPWLSVNFNVQYDNVSEVFGMNNRLSWIIQPGNVMYLVYNHNWMNYGDQLLSLESRTSLKLTYTYRF